MIYSPLEQFNIITLIPLHSGNVYYSFTNSSLYMLLVVGLVLSLFQMVTAEGGRIVPSRWQSVVEMIYTFVCDLVEGQVGKAGRAYFPFIFTVFSFILFSNLIGMVPYSFTVTSHFVVTFGLSISLFIGLTLIGIYTHGLHFLSFFWPSGAPIAMAPLLVVLEIVSYCFRPLSLGVRLFANMMAGHTLLKVIAGFAWSLMGCTGILFLMHYVPLLILLPLFGLELAVGLIQAFVFSVLTCIYLNDAVNLH